MIKNLLTSFKPSSYSNDLILNDIGILNLVSYDSYDSLILKKVLKKSSMLSKK